MTLQIVETYSEGDYNEYEVWECDRCNWSTITQSGADVCGCPTCEVEDE